MERTISCSADGKTSTIRSMVLAALEVCKVLHPVQQMDVVVLVHFAERVRLVNNAGERETIDLQQGDVVGGRRANPLDLSDLAADDHVTDLAWCAVVIEKR